MQPMLVLHAPHAGLLYINGHFAGELSVDTPLLRPVSSRGAVYLDYRPLSDACLPMARKLVFSGGAPLQESAEDADGLNIVLWPGGITEIEFAPGTYPAGARHFQFSGHSFTMDGGCLLCDGRKICALPAGAQPPEYSSLPGGCLLTGTYEGGQYLISMDEDCCRQTGFLCARILETEPDGRIRAVVTADDLAGHATLENWKHTTDGLMLISSENAWADGRPRWPQTPDETARALAEAALAKLDGEAEGYLSPALQNRGIPAEIRSRCDLCVMMKYAPPDSRPCIGLLRLESDRLARVEPLYFRASASGGPQGPWQIESLEWT